MKTRDVIINKLREAFLPESLDVTDESHLHEGHAGHRPGGETHFRVYIVSPAFEGKSRIERHRMINAALSAELAGYGARARHPGAGSGGKAGLDPGPLNIGQDVCAVFIYVGAKATGVVSRLFAGSGLCALHIVAD